MELGMTSLDIPLNNVMRKSQELEISPAFGFNQHVVENTSGYLISEPPLYPTTFDQSIPDLSPVSSTFSSSPYFPITPEVLPYLSLVETTTSQFYPIRPESLPPYLSPPVTIPTQSFPSTPDAIPYPSPIPTGTTCSSSSFPITPRDQSSSPPPLRPPSKKRGRKPKKDVNAPPTQQKPRRKFPNGRSALRSQAWIDRYFLDGICQICKGGSSKNRLDRVLEHLVSAHFVQAVKNVEFFDTEHLVLEAEVRQHFIGTQAQFEYTRRYINSIRCSFCPGDSSLVFRKENITEHLDRHIEKVGEQSIQEEKERLKEILVSKRKNFYSAHDQFLYDYPGGASSRLW
ncbi:hypothetical protein Clacol_009434 [Clathrus columnatus]|uniref:C2H2-type domain-containing protein n=1 Tax=Clathrus columnatus TaxID=1419009 RepID=A0AAV5AR16_9AGAM|nr:hypothetical protein Clacol_009434 [Clathrus columnatus]